MIGTWFKDRGKLAKKLIEANINLEISADERLEITPEIAKVISETHDELPKELQRSFRETIFESKEKFLSILESITLGDDE